MPDYARDIKSLWPINAVAHLRRFKLVGVERDIWSHWPKYVVGLLLRVLLPKAMTRGVQTGRR